MQFGAVAPELKGKVALTCILATRSATVALAKSSPLAAIADFRLNTRRTSSAFFLCLIGQFLAWPDSRLPDLWKRPDETSGASSRRSRTGQLARLVVQDLDDASADQFFVDSTPLLPAIGQE